MTALSQRSTKISSFKTCQGFTLTELLIAAFLTTSVIAIGGWAMASVISQNKTSSSRSERRIELSRALDFMAAEVREASTINKEAPPGEFSPTAVEVDVASVQPVLTLRVGLTKPVIYYIAKPANGNSTWRGPKVAYRWGPTFDNSGLYGSDQATPATWTHQPLIDALEDTPDTHSCAGGWTLAPVGGASGFYACVDNQTHRIAQLFQKGRVSKVLGATEPYLLQTQVLARSSHLPFTISGGQVVLTNPGGNGTPTSVGGGGSTPSTGGPSNVTIQFLGSDIRCGSGNPQMNTMAQIKVTTPGGSPTTESITVAPNNIPQPLIYNSQPVGTTYDFIGKVPPQNQNNPNNTCNAESVAGSGFSSMTHTRQVKVLKDGDAIPIMAAFGNGQSVKGYLSNYINNAGMVHLPNPQYQSIIVFELGATNTNSSAFDLQDLVLLVTVIPSN
jgi:hypothetical protein